MEDVTEDSPPHPWQRASPVASGLQNSWLSDYLASGAFSLLPLAHYQHLTLLPQLLPPTLCLLLGKMWEPENAVLHLVSLSNVNLVVLYFAGSLRLPILHLNICHPLLHKL